MRIVVTADGAGLDAPASGVFGRCRSYVFVDTDSMETETVENPAINAAGGAGIKAAQFVLENGAEAVITGNVGPNAYKVLEAADVPVHLLADGTVRDVVQAYKRGQLPEAGKATGPAHAGLGRGRGLGRGIGMGPGSGGAAQREAVRASAEPERQPTSGGSRQQEISELKDIASNLRKQLAEVMDRLDQLEKEE